MKINNNPGGSIEAITSKVSLDTVRIGMSPSELYTPRKQYNSDPDLTSIYRVMQSTDTDYTVALAAGISFAPDNPLVLTVPVGANFYGVEIRKNLSNSNPIPFAGNTGMLRLSVLGLLMVEALLRPVVILNSAPVAYPDTFLNNPTDKVEYINTFGDARAVYSHDSGRIPPGIRNIACLIGPDAGSTPLPDTGEVEVIVHFW